MEPTESEALDRVFRALGDETRRRIWLVLGDQPGASTSQVAAAFPSLSRWAVMKHLAVLRDADLVQTLPQGRRRCHYRIDRSLDGLRDWLAGNDGDFRERGANR